MSTNIPPIPISQPQSSPQPEEAKAPPKLKSAMKKVTQANENDKKSFISSIKGKLGLSDGNKQSKTKTNEQGNKILSKAEKKVLISERAKTANAELQKEKAEDTNKHKTETLTFKEGTKEGPSGKNEKDLKKTKKAASENVSKQQAVKDDLIFYKVFHTGRAVQHEDKLYFKDAVSSQKAANKLLKNENTGAFLVRESGDKEGKVLILSVKKEDKGKSVFEHLEFEIGQDGSIKEANGKTHANFTKFLNANNTEFKKGVKELTDLERGVVSLKDRALRFLSAPLKTERFRKITQNIASFFSSFKTSKTTQHNAPDLNKTSEKINSTLPIIIAKEGSVKRRSAFNIAAAPVATASVKKQAFKNLEGNELSSIRKEVGWDEIIVDPSALQMLNKYPGKCLYLEGDGKILIIEKFGKDIGVVFFKGDELFVLNKSSSRVEVLSDSLKMRLVADYKNRAIDLKKENIAFNK